MSGALVGWILDGWSSGRCPVPLEDIKGAFSEKWEEHVPYWRLGHFVAADSAENKHFLRRITLCEILNILRTIRANTALGPDRIGKRALLDWAPQGQKLECILNAWWFMRVIPQCLKCCPMPGTTAQMGFIHAPRCAENVEILRCVMRRSRPDGNELVVVFISFAKAFDSISHEHILDVLRQRQVDDHVVRVICYSYTNIVTRVEDRQGGATPEIRNRSVSSRVTRYPP
ncbi:hypothetical protein AOLI_G00013240 [Acnodon oligacanthus]